MTKSEWDQQRARISYEAYERHYERLAKTHSMGAKLSRESFADASKIVRVEMASAKNVALSIAKAQQDIDYRTAMRARQQILEMGEKPPKLKDLYKFAETTFEVNGKKFEAVSTRQAFYMYLKNEYGVDVANESFGY